MGYLASLKVCFYKTFINYTDKLEDTTIIKLSNWMSSIMGQVELMMGYNEKTESLHDISLTNSNQQKARKAYSKNTPHNNCSKIFKVMEVKKKWRNTEVDERVTHDNWR